MVDRADLNSVADGHERSTRSSRTIWVKYMLVFMAGEIVGSILTALVFITIMLKLNSLH